MGPNTNALPVAPSLAPALLDAHVPTRTPPVTRRTLYLCALAIPLGLIASLVAQLLVRLIALVTNLAFFHTLSTAPASFVHYHPTAWTLIVPVLGALVVGVMARFGSPAIRGHGIPEAMEKILLAESRIPACITFLKPLSAAIAIGTGGPFGAEGPIIATGGALGSLLGQLLHTTPAERKTLLASGAAAGMAATFGAPVSAVLLAVELLLFEFRPRSLIPVALAASTAAGMRVAFEGAEPVFRMPALDHPAAAALPFYILLGAFIGLASVVVTKAVYWVEDCFEHLPLHWMWWPAIGAVAVGLVGYVAPRTLGVGYYNIADFLSNDLPLAAVATLFLLKFLSWVIALGSGTSGGTLAPLFTIGGGLGLCAGTLLASLFPHAGVDPRVAALVGMAAMFAGASRALLASAVFAFETTLQPLGLLPLLAGCSAAYLVSALLMRTTIMTEKIARRGVAVPSEYAPDFLDQLPVKEFFTPDPVTLASAQTVGELRAWAASHAPGSTHQGYPVVDADGRLLGVVTRRQFLDPAADPAATAGSLLTRPPILAYADSTLRDAADQMARHAIGRLPILDRATRRLVGLLTRSDLLRAHLRHPG